jgi:hypothetical protein
MLKTTLPLTRYMDSSFFYKYPPSKEKKKKKRCESRESRIPRWVAHELGVHEHKSRVPKWVECESRVWRWVKHKSGANQEKLESQGKSCTKRILNFTRVFFYLNREFATKYSYLNCEIKILRKIATKDIIDARWWFNILISYMTRATPHNNNLNWHAYYMCMKQSHFMAKRANTIDKCT